MKSRRKKEEEEKKTLPVRVQTHISKRFRFLPGTFFILEIVHRLNILSLICFWSNLSEH